ncbi:polysaccharide biosynthesis protein [Butyrivibrio sp. FC2001]|uniref:polysaccharide biosynthesis protein n=1 Tax=Butyrivibrio sp. FC2001 TaxID=1280671 RepID=UPI00040EE48A|nr:polysaccharide biosynthesis protein [Butyrivibrio sp. FC2001]
MGEFKDKILMITGGTGSFGNAVLERFIDTDVKEIRIFSRDEKKQDDMRHHYNNSKLKFYIGDVRDINTIRPAIQGVDYIFHAAALKQVPSCEFFPLEAVKTNVIGTDNVLTAAIEAGVQRVVCLSTDKAAYPINAMGTSKAMMEKIIIAKARTADPEKTRICCTRYGNVMASRGSVIPLFLDKIKGGQPLTVTDGTMTRFIMNLNEAVDLVLYAFENGSQGDLFVQKADASTIADLTTAIKELFGVPDYPVETIGIRHGEKMYETLLTNEECARAVDCGKFYRVIADNRDLNYEKYLSQGNVKRSELKEFNSNNTKRLNVEEIKRKLLTCGLVVEALDEWNSAKGESE